MGQIREFKDPETPIIPQKSKELSDFYTIGNAGSARNPLGAQSSGRNFEDYGTRNVDESQMMAETKE